MKNLLSKYAWILFVVIPLGFTACDDDPEEEQADKTALVAKIDEAQTILDEAEIGKQVGQYPQEAADDFQTAITAANAINDDEGATQEQVDATTANLQLAIDDFEASVNVEVSPDNLVAYWKLDGNGDDASGNGLNGTLKAGTTARFPDGGSNPMATTNRYGEEGMALHFAHGSNVEVPYSEMLNPDQMSICLWLMADSLMMSRTQYIMSLNKWNTWKFELPNHGKPFLTRKLSDESYVDKDSDPVVLEANQWYQVAITTDQTSWKFYINGVLAVDWPLDNVATPIAADPEVDFVIGSFLPNDVEWEVSSWFSSFHGSLDDIRIYNKALTEGEVTAIWNMEDPGM